VLKRVRLRRRLLVLDHVGDVVPMCQKYFDCPALRAGVDVRRWQLPGQVALLGDRVLPVVFPGESDLGLVRELARVIPRGLQLFALDVELAVNVVLVSRYLDKALADFPAQSFEVGIPRPLLIGFLGDRGVEAGEAPNVADGWALCDVDVRGEAGRDDGADPGDRLRPQANLAGLGPLVKCTVDL
jgi:hypothetical protein